MDALLEKFKRNHPDADTQVLQRAYEYAQNAHQGQIRASGEPYFSHPYEVARIIVKLGLDADTIAAGLLHDVVEDTPASIDDIRKCFGDEVAELVDGVTKLGRLEYNSKEEQRAESLRKMFIAMARDIRVVMIKLADRLHNIRTLDYRPLSKQVETAKETLEIYAPLAHRLGMFDMKCEMEDRCYMVLYKEEYLEIRQQVAEQQKQREQSIKAVIELLYQKIGDLGIQADIAGRPKHACSVYRKMKKQNISFEQIYDLMAIRIIVESVKDCYSVLGVVHATWKPIPGRFKDYIAVPKTNMYQSLHTTLVGDKGSPFEIQIRTREMHRTAEYGIAAHWKYKEGRMDHSGLDEKLTWLRQLLEWQGDLRDGREFVESLKVDLFSDEVFVFTPKGKVIDLPKGATPVDFAYTIHSQIGNRCIGAKANGKIVPLEYELKTGDIIEIITAPGNRGPSLDWLKFVKTNHAKNRIRAWMRKEFKEENIIKGREMLDREARRVHIPIHELLRVEWLEPVFKKYTFNSLEDLYAAVGFGGLGAGQVILRLAEEYRRDHAPDLPAIDELPEQLPYEERSLRHGDNDVIVKGETNVLVRFAHCCNPVPGDPIIGFITRGRGITVHRMDCLNLKNTEQERHIDVQWESQAVNAASYYAQIQIMAMDREGFLSDVAALMQELKVPIVAINARANRAKRTLMLHVTLEIINIQQLDKIIRLVGRMQGVQSVFRVGS